MNKVLRHALTGSAIASGMVLAASPAQAACVAGPTTVTCAPGTTTTTNTTGTLPTDRNLPYSTGAANITFTVPTGSTVNGFGAALTEAGVGVNDLFIVNDGAVVVNAGNTPTAGGNAAFSVTSNGATDVFYSGAGTVTNNGVGDGLEFTNNGTGILSVTTTGAITSVAGLGLEVTNVAGSGSTSVTTGVVTGATGGILANLASTAGAATFISNGAVTSTGAGSDAVRVQTNTSGVVTVTNNAGFTGNNSALTVVNTGAGAIVVSGNGNYTSPGSPGIRSLFALGTGGGNVTVTGNGTVTATNSGAIFASSTGGNGNVSVTRGGAITGLTGIEADAVGTGTVTVTTLTGGTITATAGDAIETTAVGGATVVTVGANITATGDGVDATSTTGAITVNVTGGNITATDDGIDIESTSGALNVTVAAGRTVSGGSNAIEATTTGLLTVTNNGTLTSTAVGGDAIAAGTAGSSLINNNAGATINGDLELTGGVDTVNNRGTLNSFGGSNFGAGNDVLINFTGGVINLDGVVDFGAGTDSFTNNTGGTINVLANSSLLNLETMANNGRLNLDVFTLTGTAGTAFVNGPGSFIDTNGSAAITGFASMTNSGTIDLAAGTFTVPAGAFTNTATGLILVDEGATTITGQTSFSNAGVIDLLDGARNDSLVINSSYAGTGAGTSTLQVDVSGTTADTLTINGNVTGQTAIDVNVVGLGVFVPAGILVVDVGAGFTSTVDAFVIGEESGNPLIDFDVARIGQDFFLVTLLDPETAFVPLAATGLMREMWYQSADEVFAHTLAPTAKLGLSVWGNVYGSQRRTGMTNEQFVNGVQYDADNNIEIDRYGFQAGVGYGFGMAEVGLTGGYANAQANGDGEFDADGWNIGLYGRYGGLTGFHAEALFKHDAYDVSFDGLFDGNDVDASSTGVDGSVGYRFAVGVVPSLDVHAGISHVWSDMDGVSAFGFGYDFDDMTSTRGRLGVRGNFGGAYNPYLAATAYREFDGDGDVTLTNGAFSAPLESTGKGTWVRLEGGLAGGASMYGINVAGWVDFGDTRGAGIRAGFRF